MKNLTDLIAQDAEKKCIEDVDAFCEKLTKNPLFKPLHNLKVIMPDGSQEILGSALYNSNYPLGRLMVDFFFPAYITEESEQFYNKVKQIEETEL